MATGRIARTTSGRETSTARTTSSTRRALVRMVLLGATVVLSGCMTVGRSVTRPEGPPVRVAGARVLVMEPEVRLWVLSVGGVRQPQAEWTAAGQEHVRVALGDELRARGAEALPYSAPDDAARRRDHDQLVKLHRVVFGVAQVQLVEQWRLPTKAGVLDWTLGDGARSLREEYAADYALFVAFDDSYQSAGVVGSAVIVTVTLGLVAPPPGRQIGAASLVDLRTGNVVWTRNFFRQGGGDLRQLAPARTAVRTLLKDLP